MRFGTENNRSGERGSGAARRAGLSGGRILFVLLALAVAFAVTGGQGTALAKEKSLDELNSEIQEKQKALEEGKQQEEELLSVIVDLEEEIDQLQGEIAVGEENLAVLEDDLEKTEKRIEKQNAALSKRLRNMYKNGSVGFMDVLLNSGSFSDFMTNLDMVERVYRSDEEVLAEMEEAHQVIEAKKQEIESLNEDLVTARGIVENEVSEVSAQKEKIAESNKATEEEIDDLQEEMEVLKAELAEKKKKGEISSSDTSKYEGGVFLWPTPGNTEITSDYGWRNCPFHGKEFHAALDIGAPDGADIVAVAAGKVIHSGWYGGFGKSVIIDHGGGLVSQYNHCSETLPAEGDKVKRGQVIAKVGSTGYSTGPHLDFRVYLNGEEVNPKGYL